MAITSRMTKTVVRWAIEPDIRDSAWNGIAQGVLISFIRRPISTVTTSSSSPPHSDDDTLSTPLTRVTTLPNGLRIATESNLASKTATVGVIIDAGSRFESQETNGTGHFLQRMMFKGTYNRDELKLREEIDNMGGQLKAKMSMERTSYISTVLEKDVPNALNVLADMLQNSKLEEKKITTERDAILRQMKEVEERTEEVIFDYLHASAFQFTPLGRPTIGTDQNVKRIGKLHMLQYLLAHYTTPKLVVAASGAVHHSDIVSHVERRFENFLIDTTRASELVEKEPAVFTGSEIRVIDVDYPLAHVAVGFAGASLTDPDSIALMVIKFMLGSFTREQKHICSDLVRRVGIDDVAESMMALNISYKDTGLVGVYFTAKPDCLRDVASAIMFAITSLSYRVSESDVIHARSQLKSYLVVQADRGSSVVDDIGHQLFSYGRRIPLAEIFTIIDSVGAETVMRVARRFIYDRPVAISAVGPVQDLPDYRWFRRSWLSRWTRLAY